MQQQLLLLLLFQWGATPRWSSLPPWRWRRTCQHRQSPPMRSHCTLPVLPRQQRLPVPRPLTRRRPKPPPPPRLPARITRRTLLPQHTKTPPPLPRLLRTRTSLWGVSRSPTPTRRALPRTPMLPTRTSPSTTARALRGTQGATKCLRVAAPKRSKRNAAYRAVLDCRDQLEVEGIQDSDDHDDFNFTQAVTGKLNLKFRVDSESESNSS